MKEKGFKKCPKCYTNVVKDMCNKITCDNCQFNFCWACLNERTSTKHRCPDYIRLQQAVWPGLGDSTGCSEPTANACGIPVRDCKRRGLPIRYCKRRGIPIRYKRLKATSRRLLLALAKKIRETHD